MGHDCLVIHAKIVLRGRRLPVALTVDTGCTESTISEASAKALKVPRQPLRRQKQAMIADGGMIKITHETTLNVQVGSFEWKGTFDISPGTLGSEDFLLGMDFMVKYNPKISFRPLAMRVARNGKTHDVLAKRPAKGWCDNHGYAHNREGDQRHGRHKHRGIFKNEQENENLCRGTAVTVDSNDHVDLSHADWVDWRAILPGKSWLPGIPTAEERSQKRADTTKVKDAGHVKPDHSRNKANVAKAVGKQPEHGQSQTSVAPTLRIREPRHRPGKFDLFH